MPKESDKLHRRGNWYIGLLKDLPPPEDVTQRWEGILGKVVVLLKNTTARLDRSIPTHKTITHPELVMAGKVGSSGQASRFFRGADCPQCPVLLQPTVWIYCSGYRCKVRVKREILPDEPPLRDFLQSFRPPIQFRISQQKPWLASEVSSQDSSDLNMPADEISSQDSSDFDMLAGEISFAVQYPPPSERPWPAAARFTIGSTNIYSTIGGPIHVRGPISTESEKFGLTTAHGIVSYIDQIERVESSDEGSSDEESSELDSDSEILSNPASEGSYENMEVDEPLEYEWEMSELPKVLAYSGRGTSSGDYSFREHAPTTSDFALVNLSSHHRQMEPISNIIASKDTLFPGEVDIASTVAGPKMKGYLLRSKSFHIMRGAVMQTMKIQIESPARA